MHRFDPGPRLRAVLEQYHQQKAPDPLPAPEGFAGQLRPYQERGLGWLAFLYRFDQGACLADDMGLGKTIQLLAFLQHLKAEQELKRPVLLVAGGGDNCVRLLPPLNLTLDEAREAVARFEAACEVAREKLAA